MFIKCPSCDQRNPENAKQCLHCEHLLPAGEAQISGRGFGGNFSLKKNEKTTLIGVLLAIILGVAYFSMITNKSPMYCFSSKRTKTAQGAEHIARLKTKGYVCESSTYYRTVKKFSLEKPNNKGLLAPDSSGPLQGLCCFEGER